MSDHWMWRDVPPVLFLGADWQGEFALSRIRGSAALRTRLRAFERASARQEPRPPGNSPGARLLLRGWELEAG